MNAGQGESGVTRRTAWVFGVAGIAIGTINTGLNFFLLVFYDQVLGLKPALAGLALALALVVDGIMDPLVGILSDRLHSRWGRRHPFIVASIIPLAASYLAIWFPPFNSEQQLGLFMYLLLVSVALRVSQTLFDVPTNALVPELTQSYELRTTLSIHKVSFTWITSNLTGFLMYAFWLSDSGVAGQGLMNRQGYQSGALWFTGMLLIASSAVPVALRRHIPLLRRRADAQLPPPIAVLRNLVDTYSNPSILALLVAAIFLAAASGLTNAIWVYLYSFYWACTSYQVNVIQAVYLVAAVVALFWLPRLSRGVDKRSLTLRISTAFWIFTAMPYALRSVGLFPDSASPWKMYLLSLHGLVDGVLFNMLVALLFSLLADVVEESLASTGRREEGLILASQTFVSKVSTATGTWLAAGILAMVSFPRGTAASSLPAHILFQLGSIYTGTMWTAGVLCTIYLRRYRITRDRFHQVLQGLEEIEPNRLP